MTNNLGILIMAGGLGKRMESDIPKVLHKVLDIPMLVHVIRTAKKLNPFKIGIIVGKYKDIIRDTILEYESLDNIEFIYQEVAQGTGHAIQCSVPFLNENTQIERVLILSGDNPLIGQNTLQNLLFRSESKCIIMTSIFEDQRGSGRVILDNNEFIKIVEEKDCNEIEKNIKLVNCGIYSFDKSTLCKNIMLLNNNNAQSEYYLTDVVELIKTNENIKIDMYQLPEEQQYELMGVNTKKQLEDLNKMMMTIQK